eukprot:5819233-Alexandrium_andersonii.AAC.1
MSASLVGSEMCIRDRIPKPAWPLSMQSNGSRLCGCIELYPCNRRQLSRRPGLRCMPCSPGTGNCQNNQLLSPPGMLMSMCAHAHMHGCMGRPVPSPTRSTHEGA